MNSISFKRTINIGRFFILYLFLLIPFVYISFAYGLSFCDSRNSANCDEVMLLTMFIAPLMLNFALHFYAHSKSYQRFQNRPDINKITGIIQIILAPIISGLFFFVAYVITGFQQPSMQILHNQYFYVALIILIVLVIGGIFKINNKNLLNEEIL